MEELPVGGSFFRARKEDDVNETYESRFYPALLRWDFYSVVSITMQWPVKKWFNLKNQEDENRKERITMKEFKTLGYDWECGHEDLLIRVLSYVDRKRLYIGLYKEEYGEWEPFGDLTVNLPREAVKENEAFIDHNYSESKLQFIRKYQLGKILPETAL